MANSTNNGYLGLMLYLGEDKNRFDLDDNFASERLTQPNDYSESVQSALTEKLSENKTYCFKINILLSRNVGYSIDRFGVLFSNKPSYFSYYKVPNSPNLTFNESMGNTHGWETLCKTFTADGDEAYITLGRFSSLEETNVTEQNPSALSELDINKSAYYLLDDLQLYEVVSAAHCGCVTDEPIMPNAEEPIAFEDFDIDQEAPGSYFILNNILFDFDKAEIKASFIPELKRLFSYMKRKPALKIKGYTDNKGTNEYNLKLSQKRAKAIAQWLVNNGIEDLRITYSGYGSAQPLLNNNLEHNRQINRRVAFEILRENYEM